MNKHGVIKKLATKAADDEVDLVEEESAPNGTKLSFWRGATKLPAKKVAVLELSDGQAFIVDSIELFSQLLFACDIRSDEIAKIVGLFNRIAPGGRRILELPANPMVKVLKEKWYAPRLDNGTLQFLCNNFRTGVIENIRISTDLRIEVTPVASGLRMPLR